jgi:hypothetical protein
MVLEDEILEVIKELKNFFSKNPERSVCNVHIFGFDVKISSSSIEQDVRAAAVIANTNA